MRQAIAGFAAFKNHLSYLPHSGSVFRELKEDLARYEKFTGALRFDIDTPLPAEVVNKLIAVRLRQAFPERGAQAERRQIASSPPYRRLPGERVPTQLIGGYRASGKLRTSSSVLGDLGTSLTTAAANELHCRRPQ